MGETSDMVLCSAEAIREQATLILSAWGLDEEDTEMAADALTDADLRGIDSHGISLLAIYARWNREGLFDFKAKPQILRDGPTFALIDGQGGVGYPVSVRAVELAVDKAKVTGIAAVTVRNSRHFGAAGYYARLGAMEGMVTLVASSARLVCVVPPRSARPMLSTNPLAYGIPRGEGEPIVFDIATSTVAANKVRLRALKNLPLPPGWVVDGEGAPVTDPHQAEEVIFKSGAGGLTTLGSSLDLSSHKGYGLALMAHFLGGALPGATFTGSPRQLARNPHNIGHFFLAIDPAIYRDLADFREDVEDVAATLRATPPLNPDEPVLMPGDIENSNLAERSRSGVPLPRTLIDQLAEISRELDVPFRLDETAGGQS